MQKLQKKNTNPVRWITQGGDFNTNLTIKVDIVLPELDAGKGVMRNFYMYDLQGLQIYDLILGHEFFYKLHIDLCLSDNKIRGDEFVY